MTARPSGQPVRWARVMGPQTQNRYLDYMLAGTGHKDLALGPLHYLPTCLGGLAVLHVPPLPRRVANASLAPTRPQIARCLLKPAQSSQSSGRRIHTLPRGTFKDVSRMPAITVRPFFTQLNFYLGPTMP